MPALPLPGRWAARLLTALANPAWLVQAGIPGLPTAAIVARSLNVQSVSSFSQLARRAATHSSRNPLQSTPRSNYTLIKGHNSMKFGYEYQAVNTEIDDSIRPMGRTPMAAASAPELRMPTSALTPAAAMPASRKRHI